MIFHIISVLFVRGILEAAFQAVHVCLESAADDVHCHFFCGLIVLHAVVQLSRERKRENLK